MDVDSVSLSPSSRLSVVCSASAEFSSSSSDSSNYSEGSPPESRRNSVNESVIKDEHYWERRRRNNDASRRSREKRRLNDLAMEEKIMLLSAENERLKSQLESRDVPAAPQAATAPVEPPAALVIPDVTKNLFPAGPVASLQASSMLTVPLLQAAPHFPSMLQLCQLQPSTIQSSIYPSTQQPASTSTQTLFSSSTSSAFHPFRPSEGAQQSLPTQSSSVIMKIERRSPDSSTDIQAAQPQLQPGSNVIQQIGRPAAPSPAPQQPAVQMPVQQGPSLLSALLSQRRPSPTVPQSRTEQVSGLGSPPRHHHHHHNTGNKSDCESVSSSASLSPSHSSEDHSNYSNKSPQYVDRRRRNNEAAKRCRANRRAVFEYRSRRVQLLEGENEDLRSQIDGLKAEIAHFKAILAQRGSVVTSVRQ